MSIQVKGEKPPDPPRLNEKREQRRDLVLGLTCFLVLGLVLGVGIYGTFKLGDRRLGAATFGTIGYVFVTIFVLIFSAGIFQSRYKNRPIYNYGIATHAKITHIYLKLIKDADGDKFEWRITGTYEVQGKPYSVDDALKNSPTVNVGDYVWVLYDKDAPERGMMYAAFDEHGATSLTTVESTYYFVDKNPRPGIVAPPESSFYEGRRGIF